jgi:outer membrane receptor protein involved in Fe transport
MQHYSLRPTAACNALLVSTLLASCGTFHTALAEELVLEEVIVTAQKKSEALADTPMTVNVLSAETLAEYAGLSIQDIDKLTAGISVTGSGFDIDIAVRGLGTNLTAPVDPRVGLYVDGASITQERGFFTGIFDLQRFELLRGPQGTLYGKASPAGALLMQTRSPNLERVDGYVQQVLTEHSGSNTQAGVSIPLVENKLGLRLSGLYDNNQNQDATNITLDKDLEVDTWSGRAVLLWEPGDRFSTRLLYQRIEDEIDVDLVVEGNGIDYTDRAAVNDFDSRLENTMELAVLEFNLEFANNWTLTSISSHQDNTVDRWWDSDGSEIQAEEQIVFSNLRDTWNTELRLASVGNDSRLDWTVGGYYQDSKADTEVSSTNYISAGPGFNLVALTEGPAQTDAKTWAVFGHAAWHITDRTTLTAGLRYSDIERDQNQPFRIDVYLVTPADLVGPIAELELDGIAADDQNVSDDAWTGTLKLQHRFSDKLMAYLSYDRGFRDGSANVAGRAEPPAFSGFDSETSDNLEAGFKWGFGAGRGLLNLAAYFQVYEDFHFLAEGVAYNLPPQDGGGTALANPVVNVEEVESYGLEAELSWLFSEHWSLNVTASYNNTEFTDAPAVPCTSGEPIPEGFWNFNTCNLEGERAGRLPEWSGVVQSEYAREFGDGGMQWYLRGLVKAESEFYSQGLKEDLDSYATLDLFAGLRGTSRRWDVTLWLKNATDEEARIEALALPDLPDFEGGGSVTNPYAFIRTQLEPRTLGLTASYYF